jgi:hypothetical protein
MSKFLLNLLVQISKALVYSKIQFLFKKEFSSDFGPSGPAPPALARFALQATRSPFSPFGPSSFGVFAERRISFDLRIPAETPSLSHITAMSGPPVSFISFPTPTDQLLLLLVASDQPAPLGLQPRDDKRGLHSPP